MRERQLACRDGNHAVDNGIFLRLRLGWQMAAEGNSYAASAFADLDIALPSVTMKVPSRKMSGANGCVSPA